MKRLVYIGVLVLLTVCSAAAQPPDALSTSSRPAFIENKGQIIDQNNNPNPDVLYLLNTPGMNVQLRRGGFSYDLYRISNKEQRIMNFEFHRIDLDFEDINQDYSVETSDQSSDYLNYYTSGTPAKGVNNVHHYGKVIYRNLYDKIDVEFQFSQDKGYKYNFIIRPGGKISDIRLKIAGAETILNSLDTLILNTKLGTIYEIIPETFFIDNATLTNIKSSFARIDEQIFGFSVDVEIPPLTTLVIDPSSIRQWGTYYGGLSTDNGFRILSDNLHHIILCGTTISSNNIATTGAYDTVHNNSWDCYFAKFTADGVRLWGTYYGGDGVDYFRGAATDLLGNLYVGGQTTSDSCISSPGSFQETTTSVNNLGPSDAFLAKFNPNGWRVWGTYYGGTATDGGTDVAIDLDCNVYISGYTQGSDNFGTPGTYQPSYYEITDGFLGKFDSAGQRIWGTYYGHSCHFEGCCVTTSGIIYAVGATSSTDTIASQGAFQNVYGGGSSDLFLVAFDQSGQRLWATYYGGTGVDGLPFPGGDPTVRCTCDGDGNVIITGFTTSLSGIASANAWQTAIGGSQDGLIAKFTSSGQRIWGSYYGGSSEDWIFSCTPGSNGDLFFTGRTFSNNGIASSDSYSPSYNLGGDAFLVKFDSPGQRDWGTYFGGTDNDHSWSCQYVAEDTIYFCGTTYSMNNIVSNEAHQKFYNGGGDAFLQKFIDCLLIDPAGPITGPTNVCVNFTGNVYSIPVLPHAANYVWTLPAGATISGGFGTNSISVIFGTSAVSGNIWVKGVNKCGDPGDSASIYVTVHQLPVPAIRGTDTICTGDTAVFYADEGMSNYMWTVSPGGTVVAGGSPTDTTLSVIWSVGGPQWVSLNYTLNGCQALQPTQKDVWVIAGPPVSVTIAPSANPLCIGTSVTFTANPVNEGTSPVYQWKVNGINAGTNSPIFSYTPVNGDVIHCTLTSDIPCASGNPAVSNSITMTVNPILPVSVSISASGNPICTGTSVTFTALPANGGTTPSYQWQVNGINAGPNSPVFSYFPVSGDLVSCILTSSETICVTNNPDTSNVISMTVIPSPAVDVSVIAAPSPSCQGILVTFTATPVNGGSNPFYQWQVNNNNVGSNSPVYVYIPSSGDSIRCILTSNLPCVTNNPASGIWNHVSISPAPVVSFPACFDTITTLNAKPINLKGGIPLGGTYSGPGVNPATGVFTPASAGVGIKTITYIYTNVALCSASKSRNIIVQIPAAFTCGNNITDIRDNKVYPTVLIGGQCWMAENLDYGNQIPENIHQRDNCIAEKYYRPSSLVPHPSYYQWDELMRYEDTPGQQGFCPPGWHIPTEADWNTLFANWTNNAFAGAPLKYSGYSGFNAFLPGVRHQAVQWNYQDFATFFWSSTPYGPHKAWAHGMNDIDYSVSYYPSLRSNAFSVRCVRD